MDKKKVLIMAGYYVPSVKGGGPIQSIKNLVDNLSDTIDFYIVASDRDLGDNKPFENIELDTWMQSGNAKVFYTDISKLTWGKTAKLINSVNYDVIYLNSFFSYKFSVIPLILSKFKRISTKPIVIAPRGQFSSGALGLKSGKKKLFIKLIKALGLYSNIKWHATADTEREDIESIFGNKMKIEIANNLTANYKELNYEKDIKKYKGELKIIFVSRIHPKKNLKKAIELLQNIKGKIDLNIYGPLEDKDYWTECETMIRYLPENIRVSYKGTVEHKNIMELFNKHHVFLFPTLGENFGHVISEALIGGCPVIISDKTPWKDLRKYNAGWDIALRDEDSFIKALQHCVDMDSEEYNKFSLNAFNFGETASNKEEDIRKTYELFNSRYEGNTLFNNTN